MCYHCKLDEIAQRFADLLEQKDRGIIFEMEKGGHPPLYIAATRHVGALDTFRDIQSIIIRSGAIKAGMALEDRQTAPRISSQRISESMAQLLEESDEELGKIGRGAFANSPHPETRAMFLAAFGTTAPTGAQVRELLVNTEPKVKEELQKEELQKIKQRLASSEDNPGSYAQNADRYVAAARFADKLYFAATKILSKIQWELSEVHNGGAKLATKPAEFSSADYEDALQGLTSEVYRVLRDIPPKK